MIRPFFILRCAAIDSPISQSELPKQITLLVCTRGKDAEPALIIISSASCILDEVFLMTQVLKAPEEFVLYCFRFGISVLKKSHSLRFLQRLESTSPAAGAASGINDYYSVINFHHVGLSLATHLR